MSRETIIETGDAGPGRLGWAARSLSNWFKHECMRLSIERQVFRQEFSETSDPAHQAELQAALKENAAEQKRLDEGWRCSSMRTGLELAAEKKVTPAGTIERRIAESPASSMTPSDDGHAVKSSGLRTKLNGLAAVYETPTQIGNWFVERIARGAFSEVVRTDDVRLLFNHDANQILARSRNQSLRLYDSLSEGLVFWADLLADDPLSDAIAARISRGDISGCSFSFTVKQDRWELGKKAGDLDLRIIEKIGHLYDVGPVTYPAYESTFLRVVFERQASDIGDESDADAYFDDDDYWQQITDEAAGRRRLVTPEQQRQIERDSHRLKRMLRWLRPELAKGSSRGS